MSFQNGGAILGPPGAPGAPVSVVLPKANPLLCAVEEHKQTGMMVLYELQSQTALNNK